MNKIAQLGRMAAQQMHKEAKNPFADMANNALQSDLGQGALNFGANMYNKIPQGGRDMISGMAIQNFSRPNETIDATGGGFAQRHGFNRDRSKGIGVNSSTNISSGTGNTNRIPPSMMQTQRFPEADPSTETYHENFDDRVTTMTPGHAGSPWSQVLGGIMGNTSQMPTSTYPQGTPVAHEQGFRDSYVEDPANYQQTMTDRIVPRSAYNQFGGGR